MQGEPPAVTLQFTFYRITQPDRNPAWLHIIVKLGKL